MVTLAMIALPYPLSEGVLMNGDDCVAIRVFRVQPYSPYSIV